MLLKLPVDSSLLSLVLEFLNLWHLILLLNLHTTVVILLILNERYLMFYMLHYEVLLINLDTHYFPRRAFRSPPGLICEAVL